MEGSNEEILGRDLEYLQQDERSEQGLQEQDYSDEEMMGVDDSDIDYPDEDIDFTSPEPKPLGGIYQLFDTVLRIPASTKVSNLNKIELGDLGISVRESMRIALLARTFHHPIFAKFFMQQAGIISDSAMSKEGWFTELFVTSKRYATRTSSSDVNALPQFSKGKWKMFSKKNKPTQ